MLPGVVSEIQRPLEDSNLSAPCALWPVDLKLTHVDCNPEHTLVHFQGQYLTLCELDYNILQVEIQNAQKTKVSVEVGEFCLVEDVLSGHWFRGRIQNKHNNLFDVFLLDHGNILTVNGNQLAFASDDLFMLPPKIVCGFFASLLPLQQHWDSLAGKYFSSLIGSEIKGYIQGFLPHKVLILEAPDINKDILKLNLGKHVDRDTFLLLVEMLTEVPLKQSSEPVPDLLIEKPIGQEFSFKPSSLQGFENIPSFCGPKISIGKKERAKVTAAVNPGTFYCQLTSMGQDLKEMSDRLSLTCESKSKELSDKTIGNLGLLCSVKGKYEKWHRGFVQFLPVNSQVRVLFVDYGYCESVKVENIFQLPSEFLSVPIMAFPCTLSCLSKQGETALKSQLNYLKRGLLGDVLDIQIDSINAEQNLYYVTLHDAEHYANVELDKMTDATQKPKRKAFCDLQKHCQNSVPLLNASETTKITIARHSVHLNEIKEDSVFEGYVEHVLNPHNFWLRTKKRNEDFEDLMKEMTEYFSGLQLNEGILVNPVPGAACCAMYEKDMHYYRAVVTDTVENGVEVFFIDFGNTEKVPYMLIKTLPPKFSTEPEFALNCSLADVAPVEDVWTVSATEYFRQAVSDKALLVHVVHKRKDRFLMDLYEKGDQGRSISMLMVTANMAQYWKHAPMSPVTVFYRQDRVKQSEKVKSERERKSTYRTNTHVVSKNHDKEIEGQFAELHGQQLVKNVTAKDTPKQKIHVKPATFKMLTFKAGNELPVKCCYVSSPSDFWCQLKSKLNKLDELMEKIQGYYRTHTDPWQPNEVCCVVKRQDDCKWYRGCVLRAQDGDIDVICVDIGMIVKEKSHNLRAIKAEYLELEGQAFRCSLYNLIGPADGSYGVWRTDATTLLRRFAEDNSQNLKCTMYSQLHVKNKGLSNVVDLHTPFQSVTHLLVERGFARVVESEQLTPSVYPYSFSYSLFNVSIGSKEPVYVTHVCSPWELYFQLDKNSEILDLIEKSTEKCSKMHLSGLGQGRLCLAKYFLDGKWYRGLAYPVQSNSHLNVFFVDYGNMEVEEKRNVLPIPRHATDLLLVPMLALRGRLSNVPKGEVLAEVNTWLEKAIVNKLLQATFVEKDEDGTIICDLFDGSLHVNEKVNELVVMQGNTEGSLVSGPTVEHVEKVNRGTSALNVVSKAKGRNGLKAKCAAEIGRSLVKAQHTPRRIIKSLKSVDTKSKSPDIQMKEFHKCHCKPGNERTQLKSKERDSQCKSTMSCRHLKQLPASSSLANISNLPETNIKPGFRGVGYVSHVNTLHNIYIQMEADEQAILKMGEELNNVVSKEQMETITGEVNVGDVVAVEYEEDGAFYRAAVIDSASVGLMKVEFIDYGNEATVDKKNACILPKNVLTQPRLSIPCSLEKSHTFGSDTFAGTASGKPLLVEFVEQCGPQWIVRVEICEISSDTNISVYRCRESTKGEKGPNVLQIRKGHAEEDRTKEEKQKPNLCSDTQRVDCLEVTNKNTVKNKTNTIRKTQVKLQKNVHANQKTVQTSSTSSNGAHGEACEHTVTKQNKNYSFNKSNKHGTCEKLCSTTVCQHTDKQQIVEMASPGLPNLSCIEINSHSRADQSISHARTVSCLSGHNCEMEDTQIPHQDIRAGQTEDGTLLSILENGDLYIRLKRNSAQLALLDALIAENALKDNMSKEDIREGLVCLAKSNKNNQWYRAVVKCLSLEKRECSVLFFDHGSTEEVYLGCMKELCSELRQIPMQAVLCRWNNPGYPTKDAYKMLKEMVRTLMDQEIKLMFMSFSETPHIWVVEIINEIFLNQQFKAVACLKNAEKDMQSSPELCVSLKDDEGGSCAQRLSLAPVQMDLGYSSFAAAVTAPCEFYVVLEDMLLVMNTVSTLLESVSEDLATLPEAVLIPGACCLVKSETKKKWCRAEIVHVDSLSVVIDLVDYGHCAHMPYTFHSQLKALPEELARLPKVAYPCALRGIRPVGAEQWTDDAIIFFQECICQRNLLIYFRQYISESQWEVDIVAGGVNVAKQLVDAGHGTYIDSILGLRLQQESSPIMVSRQGLIQSFGSNGFRIKSESEHAEVEEVFKNIHGQEHFKKVDHNLTDYNTRQRTVERANHNSGQKKEEALACEQCNNQRTMKKELSEAVPGSGKCVQM